MIATRGALLLLTASVVAAACAPAPPISPAPAAAPADPDAARLARIEAAMVPAVRVRGREPAPVPLRERMEKLGVPAVSVAVIHNGEIAWAKAYGVADAETRAPATTETLFQAASMSKPVAAMGALALVQDRKLTLDDDVNRWLRRWRVPPHQWQAESPVTLRRLLSHTAGATVHGFPGYAAGAEVPSVVQVLSGEPPANTQPVVVSTRPGAEWRYSGGGTTVVQLLVEEVTGEPFARYMRERVLEPLGMTSSTYEQPLPPERAPRAATAHRARAQPIPGRYHTYPEMAAAGLWTTPTDLARWILSVQRALGGDTTGVLTPQMARAMVTANIGRHGLGPQVEGTGDGLRFVHGGSNAGFRGVFIGFAERGDGAVIMTNADAGATIGGELLRAIAREYGWSEIAPTEIVPVPVATETLRQYAGRYGTADQPMQVVITVEDESLIATTPDGARREFISVAPDRFQETVGGSPARFERDAAGAVVAMHVLGLRLPLQSPSG